MTAASWVIEAEAGAFERWGLHVGDVVELRTVEVAADAGVDPADAAPEQRRDRPHGG